jgi:malic enzyme
LRRHASSKAYNDDVQGTAGITLAGMLNAAKSRGTKLKDEKCLFLGAGSAGARLADLLCSALPAEVLSLKEALQFNSQGGIKWPNPNPQQTKTKFHATVSRNF